MSVESDLEAQSERRRYWRERAEQAELEVARLEEKVAEQRHRRVTAEARLVVLVEALQDVLMQATRRNRASDLRRYLVTDLEIIERKAVTALAADEKARP